MKIAVCIKQVVTREWHVRVNAAGNWELDAAWPHIVAVVNDPATPKPLLLAAIGAAGIRPLETGKLLLHLVGSDDEEIAEAVDEAIAMAGHHSLEEPDDEEDAGEFIN